MQRNSRVIGKKYQEYLIPTVLTSMATQISSFVDSVMASNFVCSKAIAAISLIMPILQLLYSVTILFGLGAASLISRAHGENDRLSADRYFSISFILVSAISIVALAIQLPLAESISTLFTSDPELRQLSLDYYRPFIIGIPIYMLLFSSIHAIRLDGRPRYASWVMIIANIVNLMFDYILMGLLDKGIAGSAWATVIGNTVGLSMVLAHFAKGRSSLHLKISDSLSRGVFMPQLRRLFTTGISGAMGALFNVLRLQFFVSIIGAISGAVGLVAFSLCTTVTRLISMFVAGASQAMIPLVSLCLGERDYQGVRIALKRAIIVLGLSSAVLMLYFLLLPDSFISLFGISDTAEQTLSHTALIINALSIPGEAFLFLFLYYFMSVGDKTISTTLSTMYGLGVLLFGFGLSKIMGINGIWWAMVFTNYVALIVAWIMAIRRKRLSSGKFPDLSLVPSIDPGEVSSFSMDASINYASEASKFVQTSLASDPRLGDKAYRIALCIEEITLRIASVNTAKSAQIDIRISNDPLSTAIISIRDNGILYNPIEAQDSPMDSPLSSLEVIRSISTESDYSHPLGFNRTLIKIAPQ